MKIKVNGQRSALKNAVKHYEFLQPLLTEPLQIFSGDILSVIEDALKEFEVTYEASWR